MLQYTIHQYYRSTMKRKYQQMKDYAKIMKYKRKTGEVEEVTINRLQNHPQDEIEEEKPNVDHLKNQDFEDAFEDQYEQEEAWVSESEEEEEEVNQSQTMKSQPKGEVANKPVKAEKPQVFLDSNKTLKKGEVLEFDNTAYDMLHRLNVEWPCMSIDFVAKSSPFDAAISEFIELKNYPYQVLTVQGSCNGTNHNSIYFTKWNKLHRTKYDDDPDQYEEDQHADEDPEIIVQEIQTTFDVNRIRTLNNSPIVAFWNDDGRNNGEIRILDLSAHLEKLGNNITSKKKERCKQIILPCESSGYAINWNPHKIGELIAGDNRGIISVFNNNQNYTHWSKTSQYNYHKGSVEDIIFSPSEPFAFASCSSDGTLQIVDMRVNSYNKASMKIRAHEKDVNVCDWNKKASHLIVTGSDDCKVKVWDLRMLSDGSEDELLCFNWHSQPITSIKFQPNEESVIAVASEDNRLTIWDMSMENQQEQPQVPNELMFIHQGQQQIKQICYHPVYFQMLVSTSIDSINIFKPSFQMPQATQQQRMDEQDLQRPPIRQSQLDAYIERMNDD